MPELVRVSNVENLDGLMSYINDKFGQGKYAEIIQAIGMHSLLIDPEHTLTDQDKLYRLVLNLLKSKISRENPKAYASWLASFPQLLDRMVEQGQPVTDATAQSALASHRSAYGPFASLDAFYVWALDDRRLPLDQIISYVMKTVEMARAC
jgi:hypothetical protein